MTEQEALDYLRDLYPDARKVKHGLLVATVDGSSTLFRIKDGRLEQRMDMSVHAFTWEGIG